MFWLGLPSLLLLTLLLVMPPPASAQQMRSVQGRVTVDETARPLPGVQVYVKGTRVGTLTDSRGNFTLEVPADAETLVFAYLGFKTAEAAVSQQVEVALIMDADSDEVNPPSPSEGSHLFRGKRPT